MEGKDGMGIREGLGIFLWDIFIRIFLWDLGIRIGYDEGQERHRWTDRQS